MICITVRAVPPRWAKPYLDMMLGLARSGVRVDEDAVIERINSATVYEITDERGSIMRFRK